MPIIQIADKGTLDTVNSKVGANSDSASANPNTVFAALKQVLAVLNTLDLNTADKTTLDAVNSKVGANSDSASANPNTVFAALKQVLAVLNTLNLNTADKTTLNAVNSKVGTVSDLASASPNTIFAALKHLLSVPAVPKFKHLYPTSASTVSVNDPVEILNYSGSGYLHILRINSLDSIGLTVKLYMENSTAPILTGSSSGDIVLFTDATISSSAPRGFRLGDPSTNIQNTSMSLNFNLPFQSLLKITVEPTSPLQEGGTYRYFPDIVYSTY